MTGVSPLVGDPASVSALATTLRRAAAELSAHARAVRSSLEEAEPGWVGPSAVRTRASTRSFVERQESTARALAAAGESLQRGAGELSTRIAELRRLEEEAAAAGLDIRDGTVTRAWGITGLAEEPTEEDLRVHHQLQQRLHATASALGRQRSLLARDCATAREALAGTRARSH